MKRKSWNVIVLLFSDQKVDRDRIRGILRYAQLHPEWNVRLVPDHPANRVNERKMSVLAQGLITNPYTLYGYGRGPSAWKGIRNLVLFDGNENRAAVPGARQVNIDNDSAACGRIAAEYLAVHNLPHLAYAHMRMPRDWSDLRAHAFQETAQAKGLDCSVYPPSDRNQKEDESALLKWLKSLPKPCGILGANDARAMQIIDLCRQCGIAIPGQIAVMGVDNNDLSCDFARPSLTSIEMQDEYAGYLAAETLDKMMRGKGVPDRLVYGSPKIVERDSTLDPKGTARIVNRARQFIAANFHQQISADDIARATGVSRRTLERRFLDAGLDAPANELRERRLSEMRTQIQKTSTPLSEIASACGFTSYHAAQAAFLRRYQMTPRDARQSVSSCR